MMNLIYSQKTLFVFNSMAKYTIINLPQNRNMGEINHVNKLKCCL